MIGLALALLIAPPHATVQSRFAASLCTTQQIVIPDPVHFDAPPWDDAIGAQAGVWWTETDGILGYSYQEDGIGYRTLQAADECPVYPAS